MSCSSSSARLLIACLAALSAAAAGARPVTVNDVHARLNRTEVREVVRPSSLRELQAVVRRARDAGLPISIAGGRHAMGGQQFGAGTLLIDTRGLNRVLRFDEEQGLVEVEAGIEWPELVAYLVWAQEGKERPWGILQKQTGADRFTLGGSLSANAHGRGLRLAPLVGDVESIVLVDAGGDVRQASREKNPELFALVAGGYGLFGAIYSITLRLGPRRLLERVVEIRDVEDLIDAFEARIAEGFLYGDFQFAIDPKSEDYLKKGVFSCYRPAPPGAVAPARLLELAADDWRELYLLSHTDKSAAFRKYARFYLGTSGQIYWSDTHQESLYVDDYHAWLDKKTGAAAPGSEMISEVYVPRRALAPFLADLRADFRAHDVDLIYGTIRLIEKDRDSFLAWAKKPWAAIVFNLHVPHTPRGIDKAAADFRRLIDRAIERGGSFFLTYHRWATREQILSAYPEFPEFLRRKIERDPKERFQSDWYRHYRDMFRDLLPPAPAAGAGAPPPG